MVRCVYVVPPLSQNGSATTDVPPPLTIDATSAGPLLNESESSTTEFFASNSTEATTNQQSTAVPASKASNAVFQL